MFGGARKAADDNMAALHARYIRLHTRKHASMHLHSHTHKVCDIYCFSTATGFVNAPQCYVIRILPVFLCSTFVAMWPVKNPAELADGPTLYVRC
jgi:hypothetical protein